MPFAERSPHPTGRPTVGDDAPAVREDWAWQILLIGGSSGTGKTVLAHQLARHFGVALTQVDDLRLALQRTTSPSGQPDLHVFLGTPDVWQRPAEELRDRLIGVAHALTPAIDAVVEHHLDTPYPLILEGDGILPAFAARWIASEQGRGRVRSVFLYASHESQLFDSMTERGRGFEQYAQAEQQAQSRMKLLYNQWLKAEADRHSLTTLNTLPRETLLARVLHALA